MSTEDAHDEDGSGNESSPPDGGEALDPTPPVVGSEDDQPELPTLDEGAGGIAAPTDASPQMVATTVTMAVPVESLSVSIPMVADSNIYQRNPFKVRLSGRETTALRRVSAALGGLKSEVVVARLFSVIADAMQLPPDEKSLGKSE